MTSHPPTRRRRPHTARAPLGLLAAAALALLAAAPAAHAAPFVDVTYDLGDSTSVATLTQIGVTTTVPPQGSLTGTQTIRYRSDSASGLVTGTAELLTFNLTVHATVGSLTYTPGGGKTFTTLAINNLHIELLTLITGTQPGQLLSGGTVKPYGAMGRFAVNGSLHCYSLCGVLGVPATTYVPLQEKKFQAPLPTVMGAFGTSIRGTATGVKFNVVASTAHPDVTSPESLRVTGTTFIVGREVQRIPVPEPSSFPLLAAGLGGLALATALWRRRVRS